MKHIKLFEDFKNKNITIDDIVRCIDQGGVIYATIIENFPDNDPEQPLNPVSVDEDGTTTIELDGDNYEVKLRNVDRIEWLPTKNNI